MTVETARRTNPPIHQVTVFTWVPYDGSADQFMCRQDGSVYVTGIQIRKDGIVLNGCYVVGLDSMCVFFSSLLQFS
jgi:hypothetical protein